MRLLWPAFGWECLYCGPVATQVIVLNGGSSSGKSGIARCLQAVLPDPWLTVGTDALVQALPASLQASDAGVEFAADGGVSVGPEFRTLEAAWILADEPAGNLDSQTADTIIELLPRSPTRTTPPSSSSLTTRKWQSAATLRSASLTVASTSRRSRPNDPLARERHEREAATPPALLLQTRSSNMTNRHAN